MFELGSFSLNKPNSFELGSFVLNDSNRFELGSFMLNELARLLIKHEFEPVIFGSARLQEELKGGDVPKSIECYMKESGASEEKARQYIKCLIFEAWKQMNKTQAVDSPFSPTFNRIAMNLARMGQCMYQHGDGHGYQNSEPRDRISALLFEPISSLS